MGEPLRDAGYSIDKLREEETERYRDHWQSFDKMVLSELKTIRMMLAVIIGFLILIAFLR